MLFVEFLLLSIVGGSILGVAWRLIEDYIDKRDDQKVEEAGKEQQ